ncbi:uncharacterized protein METZ01_LOCUS73333, partial [marine metagenome]
RLGVNRTYCGSSGVGLCGVGLHLPRTYFRQL